MTDALKVLFTDEPSVMASLGCSSTVAAASSGVHRIVLPASEDRQAVVDCLHRSNEMLLPAARRVGALCVGYLPVAPTWD